MGELRLTLDEQRLIVTAADKWRGEPSDEHIGDLFAAVERIVADRRAQDQARLAAVEALADEWDEQGLAFFTGRRLSAPLRAALAASPPDHGDGDAGVAK